MIVPADLTIHGATASLTGSSKEFPGSRYVGIWGPVIERARILYVQVAVFSDSEAEVDREEVMTPPQFRLESRYQDEWHPCEWLGTGGAPGSTSFTGWTQWSAPDQAHEFRLSISES